MFNKGDFLVSMPTLRGDYFQSTVTCMIDHNDQGAFGLVINKPSNFAFKELFDIEAEDNSIPLLEGGPVEQARLFFLHGGSKQYDQSLVINNELTLSTSEDLIGDIERGEAPLNLIALLGYAGWGPGQLEDEIQRDAWLVIPFDKDILFSGEHELKPTLAAAKLGVDLNLIGPTPGHG